MTNEEILRKAVKRTFELLQEMCDRQSLELSSSAKENIALITDDVLFPALLECAENNKNNGGH